MNIFLFFFILFFELSSESNEITNEVSLYTCENLRFDGKGVREYLNVPDGPLNCKEDKKELPKFERLPSYAKPIHYKLLLKPSLVSFDFEGDETITIYINDRTDEIRLHSLSLDIKSISLKTCEFEEYKSLKFDYDQQLEMIIISLPKVFDKETIDLRITFYGKLSDNMLGFYISTYKDSTGGTKYLASTQFESTHARQAFPCFDEPTFKATFEISLQVAGHLTAISNGDLKNIDHMSDGTKKYNFESSMYMSSYLVAFIIGEFDYVEDFLPGKHKTRVRVYTVPGKKNQAQFALTTGVQSLHFFNQWFDFPYPLPKMDMLAVPDFAMGAMENTGILTFRETGLLMDPTKTSIHQKTYIASVITHEISHQWFGNLVTMAWWDQLWLKEGFASFLEYVGVEDYHKDLNIWQTFINQEITLSFSLDSLKSSHPIEVPINNPSELEDIYDAITYQKSCSVLRMLYFYLGKDTFKSGLQIYVKKNAYKYTLPEDLWGALAEASGKNITEMMATWTKQMGYPVVSVSEEIDGTSRKLHFKQSRYLADGSYSLGKVPWNIPISISTVSRNDLIPKYQIIMKQHEESFSFENVDPFDTLIINPEVIGFYRVKYSDDMFNKIFNSIMEKKISPPNLVGLANDIFALVKIGRLDISYFMKLLEITKYETHYDLRSILTEALVLCDRYLKKMNNGEAINKFHNFIERLFLPLFEKVGWEVQEGEEQDITKLRPLLIGLLARAKNKETINKVRTIFENHYKYDGYIDPNLRSTIYKIIGKEDGINGNDKLKDIFEKSTFPEIVRDSLEAMGGINDIGRLKELFKYAFIDNKVRKQDLLYLFAGATSSDVGGDFAYEYFMTNMELLLKKFGGANTSTFQKFLRSATSAHSSREKANEVETFFRCNLDCKTQDTIDRTLKQSTERMRNSHFSQEVIGPALVQYFKKVTF
uniref:Aminopeptidase n=1 Tax=Parastrongyloides trichosuri TaxID=131310 RepID=A0A0N4Z7J0_PARTI